MSENANDEEKLAEETTVNTEAETQETVGGGMQTEPAVEAQSDGTAAAKKPNKFVEKLDKFFGISKSGSSVKTEVIGGLTTFMAMVYILMVNADMFTAAGVSYGAVYIATALSAVIGTILMALVARLPMAQASGMGLNAFFVFTICLGSGLSYANALVLILIEGVVFIILTATGLRKMLFNAIPKAVRVAIPAGIGLFIAFIGLQNASIVVGDPSTLVSLQSWNLLKLINSPPEGLTAYTIILPIAITILAVIIMAVLSKKNVKGSILWTMLGAAGLYWAVMGLGCAWKDATCLELFKSFKTMDYNPFNAFAEWGKESVGAVFYKGFDFSEYLAIEGNNGGTLTLVIITSALAFCMVDMFDTMGTLYGAAARGNLLTAEGEVPNLNKAMLCDAVATTAGAICGTSTVTTFVESSSGIGAGARTGFASVITAACFFAAMFLTPTAKLIPNAATAAALIYVGVLMMNCVREIEWTDAAEAVPAFLTIAMMPFTYNISYGMAFGIISYIIIKMCTGKFKEIHPVTYVIGALFLATFLLTH